MSYLERYVEAIIKSEGIEAPQREFRFCERLWRFDFCWTDQKVALEVEGGIWSGGRHTRGKGFLEDCSKYNQAAIMGYKVIRICKEHIDNGKALQWIHEALGHPVKK